MRAAILRSACQPGCLSAPAMTGRLVSTTLAVSDAFFLLIGSSCSRRGYGFRSRWRRFHAPDKGYGTVTYGGVSRLAGGGWGTFASGHQVKQERQLLGGIPGQIMVHGVADDQLGVLVAQVGGVDGFHRLKHGRLGRGVVDVSGDHLVDRDGRAEPDDGVV